MERMANLTVQARGVRILALASIFTMMACGGGGGGTGEGGAGVAGKLGTGGAGGKGGGAGGSISTGGTGTGGTVGTGGVVGTGGGAGSAATGGTGGVSGTGGAAGLTGSGGAGGIAGASGAAGMDAAAGSGATDAGSDSRPDGGNGGLCNAAADCLSGFCVDGVCCETACAGTCNACASAKTGAADGLCRPDHRRERSRQRVHGGHADQLRARRRVRRRRRLPQVDRRHGVLLGDLQRLDGHAGPNLRRHRDLSGGDHRVVRQLRLRRHLLQDLVPLERRLLDQHLLLVGGALHNSSDQRRLVHRGQPVRERRLRRRRLLRIGLRHPLQRLLERQDRRGRRPLPSGHRGDRSRQRMRRGCAIDLLCPRRHLRRRRRLSALRGRHRLHQRILHGFDRHAARVCDGAGTCQAATTASCAPYMCGATSCATTCTADTDCTTGNFCSAGVCVPQETNGTACGADRRLPERLLRRRRLLRERLHRGLHDLRRCGDPRAVHARRLRNGRAQRLHGRHDHLLR